jgi:hypothetical protein
MRNAMAALAVTAGLLTLVACGGDDDDSSSTTAVRDTSTGAATTADATTGATTTEASSDDLDLSSALLVASDVGDDFTATPYDAGEEDETTPCGTPSVQTVVPPVAQDGVEMSNEDGTLLLLHEVYVYEDEAAAAEALAAGNDGLECETGQSTADDGSTVEFVLSPGPAPADSGEGFTYSGTVTTGDQTVNVIFAAIQEGRAIATLSFIAALRVEGPPAGPIMQTAADKLSTIS